MFAERGTPVRHLKKLLGFRKPSFGYALARKEPSGHLRKTSEKAEQLALKWFKEILKRDEPVGAKTSCPFYPCHFESQDCTFCFCPLYPCENKNLGEFVGKERKVWSCAGCDIVHRPEVAKELLRMMKEGRSRKEMMEWLFSIV